VFELGIVNTLIPEHGRRNFSPNPFFTLIREGDTS